MTRSFYSPVHTYTYKTYTHMQNTPVMVGGEEGHLFEVFVVHIHKVLDVFLIELLVMSIILM